MLSFYPRYLTSIDVGVDSQPRLNNLCSEVPFIALTIFRYGRGIGSAIDKRYANSELAAVLSMGELVELLRITDVAAFNPSVENDYVAAINALKGVGFSLLTQLEANKDANMANVMDLLRLEGPSAETSEASQLQPLHDQLMIPIHRLEDQVIIGENSLAFSLEVAHNHVERLREDVTARRLSLTDSILPLVEPLSSRNLIGEASSSADFTTVVTTALLTNFAQTYPVPLVLSTEVPPSPKVVLRRKSWIPRWSMFMLRRLVLFYFFSAIATCGPFVASVCV
ncbi:hypothetical protein Tco_1412816 [Tanacetum coccineum]